ncbi:MAG: aquaporin Z [Porticoccaceae bacterium]|jgi:aquaporin Z
MRMHNKLVAEFIGTFWLVLGRCGNAMLAVTFGNADGINIGLVDSVMRHLASTT